MEDQVATLLKELAQQLGTTTEYLWGVTVKQATVSAITSIFFQAITVVFGVILYKLHKKFLKPVEVRTEEGTRISQRWDNLYDKYEIALAIPMVVGLFVFVVFFIGALMDVHNIATAIINPEYWALENILEKLSGVNK